MGWEIVEDRPKLTTTQQRRLIHIGASELDRKPDLVKLLNREEAAALVGLMLKILERSKENPVSDGGLMPSVAERIK